MGNMFSCCIPKKPEAPMVLEEEIKESGAANKDIREIYDIGKTLGVGSFGNLKKHFIIIYIKI